MLSFKKLTGEKGSEEQLLSFYNAVLSKENRLESVEIHENETLTVELIGSKTSILDVRAVADDNTKFNI